MDAKTKKQEQSQAIVQSMHRWVFWQVYSQSTKVAIRGNNNEVPPPGNVSPALEFLWHFFLNKQEGPTTLS